MTQPHENPPKGPPGQDDEAPKDEKILPESADDVLDAAAEMHQITAESEAAGTADHFKDLMKQEGKPPPSDEAPETDDAP